MVKGRRIAVFSRRAAHKKADDKVLQNSLQPGNSIPLVEVLQIDIEELLR